MTNNRFNKPHKRKVYEFDNVSDSRRDSWGIYKSIAPPEQTVKTENFWLHQYDKKRNSHASD